MPKLRIPLPISFPVLPYAPPLVGALAFLLVIPAGTATARSSISQAWQLRYGAISPSGENAGCQLCHVGRTGGANWNAYGWNLRDAYGDLACDLDGSGVVSNAEAFFCVESLNSDMDGSDYTDLGEIGLGTQPGWVEGPFNFWYTVTGSGGGHLPPPDIGPLDPDGTESPPPVLPPPPGEEPLLPPGQYKRDTIVLKPGDSIQAAIDRARPGTRIFLQAGVYREISDPTNALRINKSGIRLIGQKARGKRVVLENAGNQRNGIVVVPPDRNDCMGCHTDLSPPFPLHDGVEPGLGKMDPTLYDIEIRGITIRDFGNNGLFTEGVDGFEIVDVESIDNPNYGIFPTLSRNGLIRDCVATGARDSGIWVETSENVRVTHNTVHDNTNGFEVSNSDDIELTHNVARNNTVGFALLLLPDIFDDRAGAKRINVRNNEIYENNRANNARPGSVLATVPSGTGILHLGVDESEFEGNLIRDNDFAGIAIADYCITVLGTEFSCQLDPTVTPQYLADQAATSNRVVRNILIDNGTNPDPGSPFAALAADLILGTAGANGNCYADNVYETVFSFIGGALPECEDE